MAFKVNTSPYVGLYVLAACIGLSLLYIRFISGEFRFGTTTADHPYWLFTLSLIISGCVWMCLPPIIRRITDTEPSTNATSTPHVAVVLCVGLLLRFMFFGSTPIYEDDWARYLWDGLVASQGVSPYLFSPSDILLAEDGTQAANLRALDNGATLTRINNPDLTTIYPPLAQLVFAFAAWIKPHSLDAIRALYLLNDVAVFMVLTKALKAWGRHPVWASLYLLSPLTIYVSYNALHMDILLLPWLLGSIYLVRTRPFMAAFALVGAFAVKLWPLLLAPIVFRSYRHMRRIYIGIAALIAGLSFMIFWPMLSALDANSGLSAYSQTWLRSSFLFPIIESLFEEITTEPGLWARLCVAVGLTGYAFWLGFQSSKRSETLPWAILVLTLAMLFLSPTGYPWYVVWAVIWTPFVPLYSVGLLAALVPLYYVRYALGEQGHYDIYTDYLVPLQFALPLGLFMFEQWRARHALPPTT